MSRTFECEEEPAVGPPDHELADGLLFTLLDQYQDKNTEDQGGRLRETGELDGRFYQSYAAGQFLEQPGFDQLGTPAV